MGTPEYAYESVYYYTEDIPTFTVPLDDILSIVKDNNLVRISSKNIIEMVEVFDLNGILIMIVHPNSKEVYIKTNYTINIFRIFINNIAYTKKV